VKKKQSLGGQSNVLQLGYIQDSLDMFQTMSSKRFYSFCHMDGLRKTITSLLTS